MFILYIISRYYYDYNFENYRNLVNFHNNNFRFVFCTIDNIYYVTGIRNSNLTNDAMRVELITIDKL